MSEQDNSQQEPTMEEILASIRRIISEDGEVEDAQADMEEPMEAEAEMEEEFEAEEDVFDLTDVAEDDFETEDDLVLVEEEPEPDYMPEPEPEPEPVFEPEPEPVRAAPAPALDEGLLSDTAAGAAMAAFGSLSRNARLGSANTVEEVVIAALRPLLKQWLDENLPEIVEELVQREIDRVSGRGVN